MLTNFKISFSIFVIILITLILTTISSNARTAKVFPAKKMVPGAVFTDVVYGTHPLQKLDIYTTNRSRSPILIFVHGGAWKSGDKASYQQLGSFFAKQNICTVVINYRLSPEVKHPEHVRDVAKAISFIKQHADWYGGDGDKIFLAGHSAGGHLVALLGTQTQWLTEVGLATSNISGIIPISTPFRILVFQSIFPDKKAASPIAYVNSHCPPFLIFYAEKDFVTIPKQSREFHQALIAHDGSSLLFQAAGDDHYTIIKQLEKPSTLTTQILQFTR